MAHRMVFVSIKFRLQDLEILRGGGEYAPRTGECTLFWPPQETSLSTEQGNTKALREIPWTLENSGA